MDPFKVCPQCGYEWKSREAFIGDDNVAVIGYQVNFEYLEAGLFLFNHCCGTTFALEVDKFEDLYSGPVFEKNLAGSEGCPGYCLNEGELEECPMKCECAYVREIIQTLKGRGKQTAG